MNAPAYAAPKLLIAGRWRAGRHAATHAVVDPATGRTLDHLGLASAQDIEQALQAADRGFASWRDVPAQERCARLERGVARMR
jgi:acyl-CoA reductase-like NAD-dependent aldehyde dehydrogenase